MAYEDRIQKLVPVALSIVFLTILVSIGAYTVANIEQGISYNVTEVTGETHQSSGSTPEVITVNKVKQGVKSGSETINLEDSFDSTNYTLDSSNYTADYQNGDFNITTADVDGDGTNEINSTSDTYYFDYKYKTDTEAHTTLGKGLSALTEFGNWFVIIVIMAVVAVVMTILGFVRKAAQTNTRA